MTRNQLFLSVSYSNFKLVLMQSKTLVTSLSNLEDMEWHKSEAWNVMKSIKHLFYTNSNDKEVFLYKSIDQIYSTNEIIQIIVTALFNLREFNESGHRRGCR